MILSKVKVAGIGALVLLIGATTVLILWLNAERDKLLAQVATQAEQLSNAAQANRESLSAIRALEGSLQWREQKAKERRLRLAEREHELAAVQAELKEAMQDAPDCVDQPWPDAVFDIMRKDTVLDPNRVRSGSGTGRVPDTNPDTGAGS